MQDSILHPLLTVKEAMHFSSSLKIGDEMSKEDKRIRVSYFWWYYFHTFHFIE